MSESVNLLMLEFLSWVSSRRRTYNEAMEAWQSHCPRQTIWEDAMIDGYIELNRQGTVSRSRGDSYASWPSPSSMARGDMTEESEEQRTPYLGICVHLISSLVMVGADRRSPAKTNRKPVPLSRLLCS